MMSFTSLLLVGILFPALQAKQFTKCELSQVLKDMDGYGGVTLPEWICNIFHISGYDTQTIVITMARQNMDSSRSIINFGAGTIRYSQGTSVTSPVIVKFLDDDLTDDMMCAKKILDSEGIDYWLPHKPLCSEKLEQWLCEKL
ncbi:hypothetical protein QTO34_017617 [Cnephaeus nilssonii]|uniref:Uncharacterized protein n=1 Tax=Cnephaeus nilssonii TaxID=3371016 RepID=A0AA40I1G1_CNENI|nr:hypothetical protein QTO34_017617 [Eptesicus nilssonii]